MGVVKQAELSVPELAAEQCKPDADVRDVGDRRDHHAALCNERLHAPKQRCRVAQVLQHVCEQHRVEALVSELRCEVERFRIADDHPLAMVSRLSSGVRVQLDAGHPRPAPLDEDLGHVARRAAELEHRRAFGNESDDHAVRRFRRVVVASVLEIQGLGSRRGCRLRYALVASGRHGRMVRVHCARYACRTASPWARGVNRRA